MHMCPCSDDGRSSHDLHCQLTWTYGTSYSKCFAPTPHTRCGEALLDDVVRCQASGQLTPALIADLRGALLDAEKKARGAKRTAAENRAPTASKRPRVRGADHATAPAVAAAAAEAGRVQVAERDARRQRLATEARTATAPVSFTV